MPLLDNHHNVQYILISLVENTEIQTLRRIINKVKKESSIEKDILKADNEEDFLKKLTKSRSFIATQNPS